MHINASLRAFTCLILAAASSAQPPVLAQEIIGTHVTPHQFSGELRWRMPPDPVLASKVELFVFNDTDRSVRFNEGSAVLVDGRPPEQLVTDGDLAWHDTPTGWPTDERELPPQCLTVLTVNGRSANWQPGTSHMLQIGERTVGEFRTDAPQRWLSAVTFLSSSAGDSSDAIFPDRIVVHLQNAGSMDLQVRALRLWLPESNSSHRQLHLAKTFDELDGFSPDGVVPAGGRGGFEVHSGPLPLTRAVVEVQVESEDSSKDSLWALVRIKREEFDISGGWVSSEINGRSSLMIREYRQTLRRMHINTGQIQEVSGFTDDPEIYAELPLKRFNRLWPLSRYDSDAMLPTIHAVEFLGEPQYGGGRPVPPQEVWQQLAPYNPGRLPTSLTLSEERTWRYYAGLSDYPHFDAYRVIAPAADAWRLYEYPDGVSIGWGAPLETIGIMTRSLRELSRPRPIAYWSQGPHHDWGSILNPRRGSPTPDELRSQAWHGLANRVTSLYWFNLSLKSLVKFPDLILPVTRVNREVRLLEHFMLEGDAFEYRRVRRDGRPDWDLNSIATARSALMVVHDLRYHVDTEDREFVFDRRDAAVSLTRPAWLQGPVELFAVDADGTHDVTCEIDDDQVRIEDAIRVVGIYVLTTDTSLRKRIDQRHRQLLSQEDSIPFDPAGHSDDLTTLKNLIR